MYYKITIEHLDKGFTLDLWYPSEANQITRDKLYIPTLNEVKERIDHIDYNLGNPIVATPIPEKDEYK